MNFNGILLSTEDSTAAWTLLMKCVVKYPPHTKRRLVSQFLLVWYVTNSTQQRTYEVYFSEQKIHSVSFGAQNTHRILLSRPPHDGHIIVITISKNRKSSTCSSSSFSSSSSSSESFAHWFTFTDVEYKTEKKINAQFLFAPASLLFWDIWGITARHPVVTHFTFFPLLLMTSRWCNHSCCRLWK